MLNDELCTSNVFNNFLFINIYYRPSLEVQHLNELDEG